MNFREGTRRLALFVGVFGAIAGGCGSYWELKGALQQKALHDRFERLAASDDVTGERKCRLLGYAGGCSQIKLPANATLVAPKEDDFADIAEPVTTAEQRSMQADWKKLSRADQDKYINLLTLKQQEQFAVDMEWSKHVDDPYANLPDPTVPHWTPPASEINGKDIKTINWAEGNGYAIESIETEDSATLHPMPLPSRWNYFWAVFIPIFGFAVPWSLISSVRWVASGFLEKQTLQVK